jgi:hypothetical protein
MTENQQNINDILINPIDDFLFMAGRGIALAQIEMDKNSLATQVLFDNDEHLSQYGLQATWYHFPETNLELRMELTVRWEEVKREGKPSIWRRVIYAAPMNATYKNLFNYEASGTSLVKTRIVSVPPPTVIESE